MFHAKIIMETMDAVGIDSDEIAAEVTWVAVTSYLKENGRVRQQLNSFDEFINNSLQELVDERQEMAVTSRQCNPPEDKNDDDDTVYSVKFGRVHMASPTVRESDGSSTTLYP